MSETTTNMERGVWRRVYSGFLTGRRINAVALEAEATLWRAHAVADDFGVFPATPIVFRNLAFPRREITTDQAEAWLGELTSAGLIELYEVGGDSYGIIIGFEDMQPVPRSGRRVRRRPAPPSAEQKPGLRDAKPKRAASRSASKRDKARSAPEAETETETHTETEAEAHSHNQAEAEAQADSVDSFRADESDSDSSGIEDTLADVFDAPLDGQRRIAEAKFLTRLQGLWAKGGAQKSADDTDSRRLFHDHIWPEGEPPPADLAERLKVALDHMEQAKRKAHKPMAYFRRTWLKGTSLSPRA